MPHERPRRPEEAWDQFIDALDLAGQRSGAHEIRVPSEGTGMLAGRPFGELTRDDVKHLARVAEAFGRRGATVLTLWEDTQRQLRGPAKRPNARRPGRR